MRTLALVSQKGGSGKTTLAVHLAVATAQAGERVVLLDTDLQTSARAWAQVRTSPPPRPLERVAEPTGDKTQRRPQPVEAAAGGCNARTARTANPRREFGGALLALRGEGLGVRGQEALQEGAVRSRRKPPQETGGEYGAQQRTA